jgi:alpha-methylacyl-CoA racemase
MAASDSPPAPLDGVRVIDLTRLLPGGFCTLVLADLGADVIKVEDPDGGDLVRTIPPHLDGISVYFHALNRRKRSVTLNLRARDSAPVLDRLIAGADVVIESFRPQTSRRLGVSADELLARHPRLVHCSLTGFGQSGPYAERAAHDLNFMALAGLFEIDQPVDATEVAPPHARPRPARHVPRLLVADVGGAWAAVAGIAAGLFKRERTGQGSALDISIHDVAASWLTFPAAARVMMGDAHGPRFPITSDEACYNVYVAADGRELALAAIEQKFWQTFCERVGHPEFIPLQFVPEAQGTLRRRLSDVIGSRPASDWLEAFADAEVCLTPINTIADALRDPHLDVRGTVVRESGTAFIRTPIVFGRAADRTGWSGAAGAPYGPALGEHTDDVLRSVGLTRSDVADLRARGAI